MQEKDFTIRNGKWVQRTYTQPTPEQQAILNNPSDLKQGLDPKVMEVMEEIRKAQFIDASEEDAKKLQAIYDTHRVDNTELIDVDITLPDGRGIINCRIGVEHKQIRF